MSGHETLAAALAAFQADLPTIDKGETAKVEMKGGGHYTYSYADLADVSATVLPKLAAQGLSFTARPTFDGDRFVLAYQLLHTSGESLAGTYPLPNGQPQQVGSAVTYARRYCLCAVTGVAPDDDDDGRAAQQAPPDLTEVDAAITAAVTAGLEVDHEAVRAHARQGPAYAEQATRLLRQRIEAAVDVCDVCGVPEDGHTHDTNPEGETTPLDQITELVGDATNALGWYTLDRYATAKLTLLTPDQQDELLTALTDDRDAVLAAGMDKAAQAAEA